MKRNNERRKRKNRKKEKRGKSLAEVHVGLDMGIERYILCWWLFLVREH